MCVCGSVFQPGIACTRSPHSTMNLGLGWSRFAVFIACLVSSTSSAHSSPPPSQSPSLQAFIKPSWGSAAWMKQNGPLHSCSTSGIRTDIGQGSWVRLFFCSCDPLSLWQSPLKLVCLEAEMARGLTRDPWAKWVPSPVNLCLGCYVECEATGSNPGQAPTFFIVYL